MDLHTNHLHRRRRSAHIRDIRGMVAAAIAVLAVYSFPVWLSARLVFMPGIVIFIAFAVISFVSINRWRRSQ